MPRILCFSLFSWTIFLSACSTAGPGGDVPPSDVVCPEGQVVDCAGICDGPSRLDCNGVCGGDAEEDACGVCGGNGEDADNDGLCDDIDDCVGQYDAIGVCNGTCTSDVDGDGICDALDDDMDGDGILNDEETNTGDYIDDQDPLTDAANPDSDGDGVCDGPATPDVNICVAGPDAFPTDPAASLDTDGDGMPDEINGESTTGLIEDEDDDNDGVATSSALETLTPTYVVGIMARAADGGPEWVESERRRVTGMSSMRKN